MHGADYEALSTAGLTFNGLLAQRRASSSAARASGRRKQKVGDFRAAMAWLMGQAENAVARQRYKGLGEMNPMQLWETTMDPTVRRLLRVQIDDAIEADRVFTMLMGDEVEPRRDFIESNALRAGEYRRLTFLKTLARYCRSEGKVLPARSGSEAKRLSTMAVHAAP